MRVDQQIKEKLIAAFSPLFLEVEDESHRHHVPDGAQSHFKVVLVSDVFSGVSRVRRHQMVYHELAEHLAAGVHALALHTLTSAEWQSRGDNTFDSPPCHGGGK